MEEEEASRGVGDADLQGKHVEGGCAGEFGATRVHILTSNRYMVTLISKSIRTLTFENLCFCQATRTQYPILEFSVS